MIRCVGAQTPEVCVWEHRVPLRRHEHPVQMHQRGVGALVTPSEGSSVKMKVLQAEGVDSTPKPPHIRPVEPVIALIGLVQNDVEVAHDRPRTDTNIPNCFEFLQEDSFVSVVTWTVDCISHHLPKSSWAVACRTETVTEKHPIKTSKSETEELRPAISTPPLVFEAGTYAKSPKSLPNREKMRNSEITFNLVSCRQTMLGLSSSVRVRTLSLRACALRPRTFQEKRGCYPWGQRLQVNVGVGGLRP